MAKTAPEYKGDALELECVNTIRAVSADQPEAAKSGHPGAPMGCAPMAYLLWAEYMKYSPKSPKWMARDRFVLSNGHACALQYTMLHLAGYNLTKEDLAGFRQLAGKTPGHPESFVTDGIEVCTGPLGQGISNAVGLAMAENHLAATYNTDEYKIFDNYTYVICGDGCLQEGVSSEACSLAGHWKLGKLIVLYDDNNITIDGDTELSFTEDVLKRYEAYGWHTQSVTDVVTQLDDLRKAMDEAKSVTDKPSIIAIKTKIGYGSPTKEGTHGAHGAPLGAEDLAGTKAFYGLPNEPFYVSDKVYEVFKNSATKGEQTLDAWQEMFNKYQSEFPEKAQEIQRRFQGKLPEGLFDNLPKFTIGEDKDLATRKFSEQCLTALAPHLPELVGGSADLTPSNLTRWKTAVDYDPSKTPEGRYVRFGIREHGMAAICNGMFAYGGIRSFGATFLNFVGYCAGAIRLSALSRFGVIYVMTHDSIGLGEDGPTHQPIETIESLRSMPNILVYRPADSNETAGAYKAALEHGSTPTVLCLSRSTVPALFGSSIDQAASKGGYTVVDVENPELIFVGTGSEVGLCVNAAKTLTESGTPTRVVSMPCVEIFLEQSEEYQKSVLPGNIPTVSVEAASVHGWHRFAHAHIAMQTYGASGKASDVLKHFGFTVENVVAKGKSTVEFYKKAGSVPDLSLRPPMDAPPSSKH